jgi:hypothetical protein
MMMRRYWSPVDEGGDSGQAAAAGSAGSGEGTAEPQAPTWLTQVSPDKRDRKELWKYQKLNDLVDAYSDMEARQGRAIVIPDPKTAKPEEIAAFKKGMGIPEKPEDYAFDAEAFKGTPNVDKLSEAVRGLATTAGFTKGQASKAFEFVAGLMKAGNDAQAQAQAERESTFGARLLESMGGDQAKAEEVTNRLTAFMATEIGDKELVQAIADSGLLHNPAFARKIAALSTKLDDAPYIDGKGQGGSKGPGQFGSAYSSDFSKTYGGTK